MRRPWVHRIDAVPNIGREVDFCLQPLDANEARAQPGTIVPASRDEQERFKGIGSEIVFQSGGRRYLAVEVSYWRYRQ